LFERILLPKDKREKEKEEDRERKSSKTAEDLFAAIVDIRDQDRAFGEWDNMHWEKSDYDESGKPVRQGGVVSYLASLTKLTRGLEDLLDSEAREWFAWRVAQLVDARTNGDREMEEYQWYKLYKYFALLAPLNPKKALPDVVGYPYVPPRTGGDTESNKLIRS